MNYTLGVLVHGHGLVVNVDLDISAGNVEIFAVSGAVYRGIKVRKVQRTEFFGECFEEGGLVYGIIDFQEGNRNLLPIFG